MRGSCTPRLTDQLTRTDPIFLRLNLLVLLVVVFLPFPTRLVADALHETSAANGCMSPCTGSRSWPSASWGPPWMRTRGTSTSTHPHKRARKLHRTQRKFLPAVIGYVIAILIGLALPVAAVALYFGLAVYLVVPFREAARVLARRHSPRQ